MEPRVQFYQILSKSSFEVTSKLGHWGKIIGMRPLARNKQGYVIEFSDKTRLWLLLEEINWREVNNIKYKR
uniref:hypothetical protein n=1 Tax=Rhodaphanes brevistipitata TaxID=446136 RepID=UPI001FCD973C|nr:hypothetical protein MW432_pgp096 [Rhodaphanes brevistipitata]UNJ18485.1 hypothetical protein [Rhodaphanes brevistipitata]